MMPIVIRRRIIAAAAATVLAVSLLVGTAVNSAVHTVPSAAADNV